MNHYIKCLKFIKVQTIYTVLSFLRYKLTFFLGEGFYIRHKIYANCIKKMLVFRILFSLHDWSRCKQMHWKDQIFCFTSRARI